MNLSDQTFTDWTCRALDAGFRDGSGDLLRAHARTAPRFRVLTSPRPWGGTRPLRQGLEERSAAEGRVLARDHLWMS